MQNIFDVMSLANNYVLANELGFYHALTSDWGGDVNDLFVHKNEK